MAKTAVDSALEKIVGARKKGKKLKPEQKLHEFRELHITGHLNVRYVVVWGVVYSSTCYLFTVKGH